MSDLIALQNVVYALALLATSIIAALVGGFVWNRRNVPGGFYFTLLMAAISWWALLEGIQMIMVSEVLKITLIKISYLGVVSLGPLWLLFAADYSGHHRWMTLPRKLALFAVPLIIMGFVITNEWHGLHWPAITPVSDYPGAILVYGHGISFYVNMVYSYALIIIGTLLVVGGSLGANRKFYGQTAALTFGAMVPWVANAGYVLGLNPFIGLDLTPFAFAVTGTVYSWSIYRQQLFDLIPVARQAMISEMDDGIIVLDLQGRVVDVNPTVQKLFRLDAPVGKTGADLFAPCPAMEELCNKPLEASTSFTCYSQETRLWLDARVTVLRDMKGRPTGRLIGLRDITQRKQLEEELKLSNESLHAEMARRKKAEDGIRASLKEKEVLLKEIHHRVKNNLQIISSLLNLQSCNQPENSRAFMDSQDRIRSMALIHEKLYSSEDLDRIDFSDYVQSLVDYLARSYVINSGVKLAIDVRDVSLDIDMAVPCGLIITELVSNSLKYAFEGRPTGTVSVTFSRSGSRYTLRIGDDGRGMPAGLDFRESPSLGLQLVNTLVDQLEGKIDLDLAAGTVFTITFEEKVEAGDAV